MTGNAVLLGFIITVGALFGVLAVCFAANRTIKNSNEVAKVARSNSEADIYRMNYKLQALEERYSELKND